MAKSRYGRLLLLALAFPAMMSCSVMAERQREEDTSLIRLSYTKAKGIWSYVTGDTQVCQVTVVQETRVQMDKYNVSITRDGCSVVSPTTDLLEVGAPDPQTFHPLPLPDS